VASTALDSSRASQWLRSQVFAMHRDGRCTSFAVKHIANGKLGNEIFRVDVPQAADETWIASAFADIETHVEMDAGGLGGVQQYCALAYREKSADRSTGRFTFRVSVEDDLDDNLVNSEPATKGGIVAQAMRHTEVMMRSTTVAIGQVIANQARTIERLAGENDHLLTNQSRVYELLEDLSQRKHERDLENKREEFKQQVSGEIVEKVNMLLPAIVNKLAGRKLMAGADPAQEGIKQWLTSLNEQQMSAIMSTLSIEQKASLGMLIDSFSVNENETH
jgi:hypothetical protein